MRIPGILFTPMMSLLKFVTFPEFAINFQKKIYFQRIILHPKYKPNLKDHDIALIELKNAVELKHNIFPACLDPPSPLSDENSFIVSGFGKENVDNGRNFPNLRL